jgi:hypothetical protein
MTVYLADAHVQWLVSVVTMVTVLEECTTEEQRSVVRLWAKGHNENDTNKCVLLMVGSVCCVKWFTTLDTRR